MGDELIKTNRRQTDWPRSRIATIVIWSFVLGIPAAIFFFPLIRFAWSYGCNSVDAVETSKRVSSELHGWRLTDGSAPGAAVKPWAMHGSLAEHVTGIRGCIERDWNDESHWYEVELTPLAAGELRAALARSGWVKQSKVAHDMHDPPSWWPDQWAADVQFYHFQTQLLILPDPGPRAGFTMWR